MTDDGLKGLDAKDFLARVRAGRSAPADVVGSVESLPVGPYVVGDGRVVVGMNSFELAAACRENARLQRLADIRLELKLSASRIAKPIWHRGQCMGASQVLTDVRMPAGHPHATGKHVGAVLPGSPPGSDDAPRPGPLRGCNLDLF